MYDCHFCKISNEAIFQCFTYRKVENSNAVFSWDPSIYKTAGINSTPTKQPQDFFSRLNNQVRVSQIFFVYQCEMCDRFKLKCFRFQTIDFNNMEPSGSSVATFQATSPLVTLHKRERKSEFFESSTADSGISSISQSPLLKKRKFKIVPNDSGNVSTGSKAVSTLPNQLPDDRKDILKLVKDQGKFVFLMCQNNDCFQFSAESITFATKVFVVHYIVDRLSKG